VRRIELYDLLATVKIVALFALLTAAILTGLLFGLNYHNIADRYAAWYMHRRERTPAWRRWLIRQVTPLTIRASGIGLALWVAIVTALLVGGFYPPALGFALAFAAACGLLFFIMIFVFYVVDARQPHPPTSPTARLVGNVLTGLALILVAWIVFSIVQDCLSPAGCR
jgi:hypothetical protein